MNGEDPKQKFHDLLDEFDFGMLVTYGARGEVHARPMAVANVEDDCGVWLLTSAPSGKTEEIEVTPYVTLTFQRDPKLYVVLSGTARLVRDAAQAKELWSESYRPWFPGGPEDPNLVLIRVNAERGEYWDVSGANRVTYAYEFVRSYVTGEVPDIDEREQHGRVELR